MAQSLELGRQVCLCRSQGRLWLPIPASPDPAGQRRQADTQILRNRSPCPPTGQRQTLHDLGASQMRSDFRSAASSAIRPAHGFETPTMFIC
jgi:hypothetical protein